MKLFTRYTRINLVATVIIFLLASIAFYFLLRYILVDQLDENLKIEQQEIETYAAKYQHLPEVMQVRDQQIDYAIINEVADGRRFRTVKLYDSVEHHRNFFRQLVFTIRAGGQLYRVSVGKSLEGTDEMTQSIIVITAITILLILLASLLINRLLLRKLWQPFYHTLSLMRNFELGKQQQLNFPPGNIDEFVFMNDTLKYSISKAEQDYLFLKEFTENASHELQTPLAIIQSKLDLLIQDEHMTQVQSDAMQGAYQAIQKLSRLNQSLLLLAKIENGQYTNLMTVDLAQKTIEKLFQFEELIRAKGLTAKTTITDNTCLLIDPILLDILLNNFFSNAIRYNRSGGIIRVIVKPGLFEISNTAINGALDASRIFRRFGKTTHAKEGTGLGLAIVKQVCQVSKLDPGYEYRDNVHYFSLTWAADSEEKVKPSV